MVKNNFGKRLKEIREAKRITLAELSRQTKIAANHIWMLEAGRRSPSWKSVLELARALGVKTDDFC